MEKQKISRQAHISSDLFTRKNKALKIEQLLQLSDANGPLHVLEVGCGSGGISNYFATHPNLQCQVVAVDVHDNRHVFDGYQYIPVHGVELPFSDNTFDVVISNHVIEHVGDADDQLRHLQEIRRVLRPGGKSYLAVPNRWMVTEPHYRIKFLSWLPKSWRSPYLRWRKRGEFYDCEPLQFHELELMLQRAHFNYQNLCIEGLRATFEIERAGRFLTRIIAWTPDFVFKPFIPLIPTLIYKLNK